MEAGCGPAELVIIIDLMFPVDISAYRAAYEFVSNCLLLLFFLRLTSLNEAEGDSTAGLE